MAAKSMLFQPGTKLYNSNNSKALLGMTGSRY
jgi:hypothetical protein